jgi:hypothetical protein
LARVEHRRPQSIFDLASQKIQSGNSETRRYGEQVMRIVSPTTKA